VVADLVGDHVGLGEVAAAARAEYRAQVRTFVERLTGEAGHDWAGVTAREVGDRRSGADDAVRVRWRAFAKGFDG
jgi:hypothetical protein